MSRAMQNIATKMRARRARREFDYALHNASPSLRQELVAIARSDRRSH